jgi:4-hydroxybenzoate polyprenyltransferase
MGPNFREAVLRGDMTGTTRKFCRFTKIEHSVFSLPLIFAGAWLGAGRAWPGAEKLLLLALAGVGARMLGMSMNRILDRHIDAQNPRTRNRELPSGELSLRFALGVAGLGFTAYELACFLLGPLVLLLSPLPALVLVGYSLLKRFTPLCHYGIGLVLGLAPLGAYVAVKESLDVGADALWLSAFALLWMSGFDIIYALLDLSFDRASGVRSVPAALGSRGAQVVAGLTHAAATAALLGIVAAHGSAPLALIPAGIAGAAFASAYLPFIPLPARFFPLSAIAGVAGAAVPFF